jgi:hypothetical protein
MTFPTWTLGAVRITSIKELELPIPGPGIVLEATPERLAEHAAWLAPRFVTPDGRLRLLIQALVIESRGRRIVVDTCVGNGKARALPVFHELQTSFLDDLARRASRAIRSTRWCVRICTWTTWAGTRCASGAGSRPSRARAT